MVDLSTLTPAERAQQLGHPDGEIGLAITERLNTVNRRVNEAVFFTDLTSSQGTTFLKSGLAMAAWCRF
ncbi:hypothetical protein [Microvirga yunnanensis]|uniref:hypothetical protein n=1 Tax=Microvirga yunnanensis TaxID=2953740 RepID=UPI0021C863B4|nr:hypothetical protein [Microvirga sp. HBU65207]